MGTSLRSAVDDLQSDSREIIHGIYGLTSGRRRCVHALATLWNQDELVLRRRLVAALQDLEQDPITALGLHDGLPRGVRAGYEQLSDDIRIGAWRHHRAAEALFGTRSSALHGVSPCPWLA